MAHLLPSTRREEVPMSNAAGPLADPLIRNDEYRRLKKKKLQVKDRMYSIAKTAHGAAHT
jgi:hypothetical protein